ncbi:MAG: TM2 domain-containing protein [Flammeovirgaceae bacterium]
MKKLLMFALAGIAFLSVLSTNAYAEKYRINESAVEAVFASSMAVSPTVLASNTFGSAELGITSVQASSDKSALAAIVIDFFLGGFGIHRVYLGGKGILVFGYIITCGGIFGLVPFIDLIVLAVNYDDISKYVGNNKFFMW